MDCVLVCTTGCLGSLSVAQNIVSEFGCTGANKQWTEYVRGSWGMDGSQQAKGGIRRESWETNGLGSVRHEGGCLGFLELAQSSVLVPDPALRPCPPFVALRPDTWGSSLISTGGAKTWCFRTTRMSWHRARLRAQTATWRRGCTTGSSPSTLKRCPSPQATSSPSER